MAGGGVSGLSEFLLTCLPVHIQLTFNRNFIKMTMTSNIFIDNLNESISIQGRNLVVDFFITFSRFECALKATILFANGNQKKVEPNWDRFTASIRNDFNPEKNEILKNAVHFLLSEPPRIQVLISNTLEWRNRLFDENTPVTNKLSLHIRDIRNNLFHGGKYNGNFEPEVSRNYKLIESAMIVLNEWLSLNEAVRANFLKEIH